MLLPDSIYVQVQRTRVSLLLARVSAFGKYLRNLLGQLDGANLKLRSMETSLVPGLSAFATRSDPRPSASHQRLCARKSLHTQERFVLNST